MSTLEIETGEGCALVWTNNLPHRVRNIQHPVSASSSSGSSSGLKGVNGEEGAIERTFVNFFVVDPSKPLVTLETAPDHPDEQWPKGAKGLESAKEFRSEVRRVMGKTAGGWGFTSYGQC